METAADMKASAHAKKRAKPKTKTTRSKAKTTKSQPATPKPLKFVPETPGMPPTKRISPETWEFHKEAIVYKYDDRFQGKVLRVVREEMKEEYGFEATNRQYVHQLGPTKWHIPKYKKGASPPLPLVINRYVPPEMDSDQRRTLLADVLFAAGYSGASQLYKASLPGHPDDLRKNLFALGRASQTCGHADMVVPLLDAHANGCLRSMGSMEGDHGPLVDMFDIMVARIMHDRSDQEARRTAAQIEGPIRRLTKKQNGELRPTFARLEDHRILIPYYVHLSYVLVRWNDFAPITRQPIAVESALRLFINKQLKQGGAHPLIDRLEECLNWCIEILDQNPEIPTSLAVSETDSLTGVYQIIGTLWRAYVTSDDIPIWASNSEASSGMSAAELLVTLICTAMAPEAATVLRPLDRAREGFHTLAEQLDPQMLLDRFLDQLRRTSDKRMLAPRLRPSNTVTEADMPPVFAAFLNFVADTLRCEAPRQGDSAPIHPVVLGDGV